MLSFSGYTNPRSWRIVELVQEDAERHDVQCAERVADVAQGVAKHAVLSLSCGESNLWQRRSLELVQLDAERHAAQCAECVAGITKGEAEHGGLLSFGWVVCAKAGCGLST